jgi:hypothetical protein
LYNKRPRSRSPTARCDCFWRPQCRYTRKWHRKTAKPFRGADPWPFRSVDDNPSEPPISTAAPDEAPGDANEPPPVIILPDRTNETSGVDRPNINADIYAKAKPLFILGAKDLKGLWGDPQRLIQNIANVLRDRMTSDSFERMSPYLDQFAQDIQHGVIKLGEEE